MKKVLLTGVALIGASTTASAQPPVPFNWTGCYIGAHAGHGWGKTHSFTDAVTADTEGWFAGGQIGCDYQFAPNWVVGVEGIAAWADIHSTNDPFFSGKTFGGRFSTQTDWIASATARLGFGMDRWLIYGKGGAAWSDDEYRRFGDSIGGPFDNRGSKIGSGWTWGGGFEWVFAPNWSAKIEYNYFDFNRRTVFLSGLPGSRSFESRVQTVILGVNHRFSTGRP